MSSYIGFIPLDNMTDQALDAAAKYIRSHDGVIVCHYQNALCVGKLYERLGREYPDYICIHNDKVLSYQRIVESCNTLLIYWDGRSGASQKATSLENKPDHTYLILPSGNMIHFHENYSDNSVGKWITRPDTENVTPIRLDDVSLPEWDGLFTSEHFFLSALSTLETPDQGFVYPSLLHALTARAIREEGYKKFFQSTRILYGADIMDWLKDYNIDVDSDIFTDTNVLTELLLSRLEHNKAYFEEHPFNPDTITLKQSYPTDVLIASLIKGEIIAGEKTTVADSSSIVYVTGDMFDNPNNGILFIPVNCKGTMGAGLALDTAEKYPEIEAIYKKACKDKNLDIGKPMLTQSRDGKFLLLFPTKNDWRSKSKIEYIEDGIRYFYNNIVKIDQALPLHIPKLGCGLGGLDWAEVNPVLEKYFVDYGSTVYIYI